MNRKKNIALICITIICIAVLLNEVNGYADDKQVVKVGFYPIENYIEYDNSGNLVGFEVEYFNRIAEIKNLKFEYINVENITNGYKMLDEEKIDILAPVTCDRVSSEYCTYGEFAIFSSCGAIAVDKKDTCMYEDYAKINKMKIGVVKDVMVTTEFQTYVVNNNLQSIIVEFNTIEDVKQALKKEEIDGMAINILDCNEDDYSIIAKYSSIPMYIAEKISLGGDSEDRNTYLEDISSAISKISTEYNHYTDKLMEKYLPEINKEYLTKEDMDYASNVKRLTVGYIDNQKPLSYSDEQGKFSGICRDVLDIIQKLSGFEFTYVKLNEKELDYNYLLENNIDIIAGIDKEYANINMPKLEITNSYFKCKKVIVGKNSMVYDESNQMKMSVANGTEILNAVTDFQFEKTDKKYYGNIKKALDAVMNGESDYTVQNEYVIDRLLSKPQYDELKILPVSSNDCEICLGIVVAEKENDLSDTAKITNILNKVVSHLDEKIVDLIVTRQCINTKYKLTFWDILYKYRYEAIVVVLCLLIFMFFIIKIYILRKKYIKKLRYLSEIDGLTGIYNKRALIEKGTDYFQHNNGDFAIIFIDLDNFKMVNDIFGHVMGDQVIIDTANVIKSKCNNGEIVGRFGGDEFCILTHTNNEKLICMKFEEVRKLIKKTYDEKIELTASIGVIIVKKNEKSNYDFIEILNEADKVLYSVKEAGKNRVEVKFLT